MTRKEIFQKLYNYDCKEFIKSAGEGRDYMPWADVWWILNTEFESVTWQWESKDGFIIGVLKIEDQVFTDIYPIDVNPTKEDVCDIAQRAMVKCAARAGLGLSIWRGSSQKEEKLVNKAFKDHKSNKATFNQLKWIDDQAQSVKWLPTIKNYLESLGHKSTGDLTFEQASILCDRFKKNQFDKTWDKMKEENADSRDHAANDVPF